MEGKVLAGSWREGEGPGLRPGRQVASGAPSLAGRLLRLLTEPLSLLPSNSHRPSGRTLLWQFLAVPNVARCQASGPVPRSLLEVQTPSQELIGQAPR